MSSDMCSTNEHENVIVANRLTKEFLSYENPAERLFELIINKKKIRKNSFLALSDVSFTLAKGEVLGVIGVNGAGKSTLLQLIAGTISPTSGSIRSNGRVAAILELGSGFNSEFSGKENIYLNAATLGLDSHLIDSKIASIIEFSGISSHIDKPVKTYSSGMLVRLAFAIATSVDPDILIIDEALSVGDGAFRRRSFDRIMEIQRNGAAILFCSHSLHQVETFCDRTIWLHDGKLKKIGQSSDVVRAYQDFLDSLDDSSSSAERSESSLTMSSDFQGINTKLQTVPSSTTGEAQFLSVNVCLDGQSGTELSGTSGKLHLEISINFQSDANLPAPTAAVAISTDTGRLVGSSLSHTHSMVFTRDASGIGYCKFSMGHLPLTRGRYRVGVYLFCENGIHGYAMIDPIAHLQIHHPGKETGYMVLPGTWETTGQIIHG